MSAVDSLFEMQDALARYQRAMRDDLPFTAEDFATAHVIPLALMAALPELTALIEICEREVEQGYAGTEMGNALRALGEAFNR